MPSRPGRFKGPADRTGEHDVYDPATNKWTSAAPMPTPRSGLGSAYYHSLILVLGGELPPDHTFPENEAYDPKTDRWTTLSPIPHGRHGFGGDVIMLTLLEAPSRLATPARPVSCSCFVCREVGGANPEPLMSALPPKADIDQREPHFHFVPKGDITLLGAATCSQLQSSAPSPA